MLEGDEMWSKRSRKGLKDEKVLEVGRVAFRVGTAGSLWSPGGMSGKGQFRLDRVQIQRPWGRNCTWSSGGIARRPGWLQRVDGLGSEWIRSQLMQVCIPEAILRTLEGFGQRSDIVHNPFNRWLQPPVLPITAHLYTHQLTHPIIPAAPAQTYYLLSPWYHLALFQVIEIEETG